jgi:hypothetical protein
MNEITTPLSKKVFFVCLLFFLLLQAYGICFPELRIQFEASSGGVWMSSCGYTAPMYRYAFILNKFLVLTSFWLHLPMKVAGIMSCINDAVFYLIVAFLIIRWTRRYDYAAAVLAAPVLIHGFYFYFVVNEIFLSGSLLTMYTALYRYMDDSRLKKVVLAICMFFVIWSHPIMILVLLVFFPFIFPTFDQIRKAWPQLLFIAINVGARLALLSSYDDEKMSQLHGQWFEFHYWWSTAVDVAYKYLPLFVFIFLGLFSVIRSDRRFQYAGLLITPLLFAFCNSIHLSPDSPDVAKYLYPVTLFLLLQGIIFVCSQPNLDRPIFVVLTGFLLLVGLYHLVDNNHGVIYHRAQLIKKINNLCVKHQPGHSKWFVKKEIIDSMDGFSPAWHTESIFFSSFEGQHPTIQVVRASKDECRDLLSYPAEKLYFHKDLAFPINTLNAVYFDFKPENYKELVLDSAEITFLRE